MNHDAKVWLNGNLIPWREATVPILSHGFSRGSAIFEVLGMHVGPQGTLAFKMDAHLQRLLKSAELLGMRLEFTSAALAKAVQTIVRENRLERGLVKIRCCAKEFSLRQPNSNFYGYRLLMVNALSLLGFIHKF